MGPKGTVSAAAVALAVSVTTATYNQAWGSLTLGALHEDPPRFNELGRRVDGVSERRLSQTLRALERDGLVRRDAQPTKPPRVETNSPRWDGRSGSGC
jgi:DNA-binding HxlR family transcriptional regulator